MSSRRKWNLLAVLCLVVLAVAQLPTHAATYYVAPTGNNSNNGSSGSPWLSIDYADANALLVSGDTVSVAAGTYTQSVRLTPASNGVTYKGPAYTTTKVVSDGVFNADDHSLGSGSAWAVEAGAYGIKIDGFTIKGGNTAWWGALSINNAGGVEVSNCLIDGAPASGSGGGIPYGAALAFITSSGCFVHNNVILFGGCSSAISMLDSRNDGNRIINNFVIGNNSGYCIQVGGYQSGYEPGLGAYAGQYDTITNNIFMGGYYGMELPGNPFVVAHRFNMFYGFSSAAWGPNAVPGPGETNGVNPLVNTTGLNIYKLKAGSPAIDAGCLTGLPFNGAWPDIGFSEYAGTPNTTPTATVTGTVTDKTTAALLPGVEVGWGGRQYAYTDSNGVYTVQMLTGSQTGKANLFHYRGDIKTATLVAGTNTVNFQLSYIADITQHYVSPNGDDSLDGYSPDYAWKSIDNGNAKGLLQPGDTVHVAAGNYIKAVHIDQKSSGVFYKGEPGATVISDGTDAAWHCQLGLGGATYGFNSSAPAKIDGFTIMGGNASQLGALLIYNAWGIEVSNCVIDGSPGIGPGVVPYGGALGFICSAGNYIHNNVIKYGGCAAAVWEQDTRNDGNVFVNNTMFGHPGGYGIYLCVYQDGYQPGLGAYMGKVDTYFNNIIYGGYYGFTYPDDGIFETIHDYNMFYGFGSVAKNAGAALGTPVFEPETIDPLFVDMAGGNYHLQTTICSFGANSPAIDAGTATVVDRAVVTGYKGSAPDIGAFEANTAKCEAGTVVGTVTANGSPLAGAVVSAPGTSGTSTYTTGANGQFTLLNVMAGTPIITANAAHFYTATQMVALADEATVTANFTMTGLPYRTFYVLPAEDGGSDDYDGLAAAYDGTHGPWADLVTGDAKKVLVPGDTVIVKPGVGGYYYPSVTDGKYCIENCSGTVDDPITYKADGTVIIDQFLLSIGLRINGATAPSWAGRAGPGANYVTLDGFTINDSDSGYPLNICAARGTEIKNCTITGYKWTWQGLWMNGAFDSRIHNNLVRFPGFQDNGDGTFNLSHGITDYCFEEANKGSGNKIYNNTIVDCSGEGIFIVGTQPGRVFKNNIIFNSASALAAQPYMFGEGTISTGGVPIDRSHNMWFGHGLYPLTPEGPLAGTERLLGGDTLPGPGDVSGTDPLFVDTTNEDEALRDYHLQSTSPAIDAGAYVGLDFNGLWPDIGAFESAGTKYTGGIATVTGKVTSASDGTSIAGALVVAGAGSQGSAITNATGNYTLQIKIGAQPMTASKSGYTDDTETPTLVAGANTVNFQLGGGPVSATPIARLSELKAISGDTTRVQLTDAKIVSVASGAFAGNVIYIQESDRTCGIKVVLKTGQSVAVGNGVKLTGTLKTDANGERYIENDTIDSNDGSTTAPKAVGVANNGIPGLAGILVKVWGSVTAGTGSVTVNDGSLFPDGSSGITVSTAGTTKTIGSYLTVTGIVGKTTGGALIVMPRGDADID